MCKSCTCCSGMHRQEFCRERETEGQVHKLNRIPAERGGAEKMLKKANKIRDNIIVKESKGVR